VTMGSRRIPEVDVVVVGGGPAGSAAARLLAMWGHSVAVLVKDSSSTRGLAESLPPSSRKLFAELGLAATINEAGFQVTSGNTVWWGAREGKIERFPPSAGALGLQVFRPDLDRLMLHGAADAGAHVLAGSIVRRVQLDSERPVVEYDDGGETGVVCCSFVIDASGRAGVIARKGFRRHEPGFGMQALIGVWERADGWDFPDPTHTVVETFEDGWAWSVPLSRTTRHLVVMVDGSTTSLDRKSSFEATYRHELAKARQLDARTAGAVLQRTFACDASLYSAHTFGGANFLLAGDAGSFIDPLSSFGVKKALASGWLAAIAVRTVLRHPDRRSMASEFFSAREERMYASYLARSRDYAREACERHPHPFWASRAEIDVESRQTPDVDAIANDADVQSAFDDLKRHPPDGFSVAGDARRTSYPLVRGNEVVLEDAFAIAGYGGVRFVRDADLVAISEMADLRSGVIDLFERYRRRVGPIELPSFLSALSVLVAKGILRPSVSPRPDSSRELRPSAMDARS
jgi:FADH2-dependent halogenase